MHLCKSVTEQKELGSFWKKKKKGKNPTTARRNLTAKPKKAKPAAEIQPTSKFIATVYEKYCSQSILLVLQATKLCSP